MWTYEQGRNVDTKAGQKCARNQSTASMDIGQAGTETIRGMQTRRRTTRTRLT